MAALLGHIGDAQGETAAELLFHGQVLVDGARILEASERVEGQPVLDALMGAVGGGDCRRREGIGDSDGGMDWRSSC